MNPEEVILNSRQVTVEFEGFKALNDMEFHLKRNELRFLIGPNGAGKTTFLDVLCGKVKPAKGQVTYTPMAAGGVKEAVELTRKKEHQIALLGISRKFQAPSVFPNLSVWENLALAVKQPRGVWHMLFAKLHPEARDSVEFQMDMIGLSRQRNRQAGELSHGEKQWLEIGMMLAQDPQILLLDEPVAGMTDTETEKTGELLHEIVKRHSVIVVEHDMEFVREFSTVVTVMHEGRRLMEGTMEEVQNDETVATVYLGRKAG